MPNGTLPFLFRSEEFEVTFVIFKGLLFFRAVEVGCEPTVGDGDGHGLVRG
jgi:hypothetical protein